MLVATISLALIALILLFFIFASWTKNSAIKADNARLEERITSATKEVARLEAEKEESQKRFDELSAENTRLEQCLASSNVDVARLEAEKVEAQRRFDEWKTETANAEKEWHKTLEQLQVERQKQSEERFRNLATDIMEKNSASLRENAEQKISELLNPLKENIDRFRTEVNECYNKEARERFSLQDRIKELIEANQSIGREAKELSMALRGNSKTQGDWGELVLETILEKSGLRKDYEYTIQQQTDDEGKALRDEEGHGLRPDVVVHYPGRRVMIIDSKVSLTAFVQYANADNEELAQQYGKQHVASMLKHVNELSEKRYQDYLGDEKLDFVMMFVPNEAAYAAALTLEPTLWQKAYDKRVLIVSPTQLVGSLKVISQLWSTDRQRKNAIEIAEKSGQMYDKFVGFVEDMSKIEKAINSASSAYDSAMKKLRSGKGNLISRAENLKELGIKTSKQLPQAEDSDED